MTEKAAATGRVVIDGLEYQARLFGGQTTPEGYPMYSLTLIGRRGRPLKQHRPGALRPDGTWRLGVWCWS